MVYNQSERKQNGNGGLKMSKKILILSTSFRNRSNSEALADAFAEGAKRAGHTVQTRTLRGKSIAFC